ncbi:hypothetical protein [Sphaerospermopsis torques-reginae]|uniref:Uncharacterized protein n=1 Tax=Sphaerospermopsis torques-reginae ITEP-024 TaxID=984208 RepID=A0ABX8X012_9CYAN|nr:hypothetical protein [Sphaerospermopsis torques-reginae]QYX32031.1 hypothetical protein K2F26_00900 [Sphaerospermopsis torques-reginae ITEP-024]
MTIAGETTLFNNQSILQNFTFGEEIDEQAAEIISGGVERFTLKNATQQAIIYTVDDVAWIIKPNEEHTVITDMGGKIRFDGDTRDNRLRVKGYNLRDAGRYVFSNSSNSNPNRIDLYRQA